MLGKNLFILGAHMCSPVCVCLVLHPVLQCSWGCSDLTFPVTEGEGWDRRDLLLPGQQLSLVQVG